MPFVFCLLCLINALFIILWTGLNMMQAAWTFDSQWGMLLLCGIAAAVSVMLTAWQSTRGEMRSALRGLMAAGVYSALIFILRFALRSYPDAAWLIWLILASAFYVPLYAAFCVVVQRRRNLHAGGSENQG